MRAVVLAVKENKAAVAYKGGALTYIDDKGYVRGQILDIPVFEEAPLKAVKGNKGAVRGISRYASSVAAAASILILTGAVTSYALPVSTVTVDVNPSLSMGINIFDRVVSAGYHNDDGKELLMDISGDLRGKSLPEAMDIVFDEMAERDYIDGEDVPAESTVTGFLPERRRDRMMEELYSSAERWNKAHDDRSVSFEVKPLDDELKKEAMDKGMTPGQVLLDRRAPKPPEDGNIIGTEITDTPPVSGEESVPETAGSPDNGSYNGDSGNTDKARDNNKEQSHDNVKASDPERNDGKKEKPEDDPDSHTPDRAGNGDGTHKDNGNPVSDGKQPAQDNSFVPQQDNGNHVPGNQQPQDNSGLILPQDNGNPAPGEQPQDNSGFVPPQDSDNPSQGEQPQDNSGFIPPQDSGNPPAGNTPPENSHQDDPGLDTNNGGNGGDSHDGGNDGGRDSSHGEDHGGGNGSHGGDHGGRGGGSPGRGPR